MWRWFNHQIYFDKDEGGGGGGGKDQDPGAGFQALLRRSDNDTRAVAELLYRENHDYRERNRALTTDLDTLRKQVPAQGTVVLSADDAKAWDAYKVLGKPEELGTIKGELSTLRRDVVIRDAAAAHSYKPSVLGRLLPADAKVELKDETKDGKTAKVAYVVGADGKTVALPDWAQQNCADFLPALGEAQGTGQGKGGTPFVPQNTGHGQPPNAVEDFITKRNEQRAARPNPLMPKE